MNKTKLLNIVAFCALMENRGILSHSPSYIEEKFERYCKSEEKAYKGGLDKERSAIISKFEQKWLKNY